MLSGAACIIVGERLILKIACSLTTLKSLVAFMSAGGIPTTTSTGYIPDGTVEGSCSTAENCPELSVVIVGNCEATSFSEVGEPIYRCSICVEGGNPVPVMVIQLPGAPKVGLI